MDELIKVDYSGNRPTVSARELHNMLEVGTAFKDWFPRMAEYGFSEGTDFNPLKFEQVQNEGGRAVRRELTDYQLTISMAKEICMIQRNERGKQARKYFLKIEEQWNSPEAVMARALTMANSKIKALEGKIEKDKPKVLFANSVSASKSSILVGEMAKILRQNGVEIGEKRFFQWLRDHGYIISRHGTDHNMPTQYSMERGLFEVKETSIAHSSGTVTVSKTPKITGKGQTYFVDKFLN